MLRIICLSLTAGAICAAASTTKECYEPSDCKATPKSGLTKITDLLGDSSITVTYRCEAKRDSIANLKAKVATGWYAGDGKCGDMILISKIPAGYPYSPGDVIGTCGSPNRGAACPKPPDKPEP